MKTSKKFLFVVSTLFVILISSCTTTKKTLFLQEVSVTGPINQTPIHIVDSTDTPSITFSPRFSFSTQKQTMGSIDGHTPVNSEGVFQVDTIINGGGEITYRETQGANNFAYVGHNLIWNVAVINAGLDLDLRLTRNFAFFTGVNYTTENNKSLWGGNVGLGLFGINKGIAFRFDAGINIQEIAYDAYTIVRVDEGSDHYLVFYHDIDKEAYINPFINFTLNTAFKDWLVNIFFNAGYSVQTIVDFPPETPDPVYYFPPFIPIYAPTTAIEDLRGESIAGLAHVTPGIHFRVFDKGRILLGAGIYFETQLDNATTNVFILPMMQFDFSL